MDNPSAALSHVGLISWLIENLRVKFFLYMRILERVNSNNEVRQILPTMLDRMIKVHF